MVDALPTIEPFIGYQPWEQDPVTGRPKTLRVCDMDFSGTKTYAFSRQGFRGEDFDPWAKRHIFFSGCSYTFGTGLNYEETAAHLFKLQYCKQAGLDPMEVNLLNFAMPGASNDYIVRTMISQCQRIKPDVAIVLFSHTERAEFIDEENLGERVWTAAPWWIGDEPYPHLKPPGEDGNERVAVIREASIGYFYYATPGNSMARFLRNALLMQYYLEANAIPFVFHWADNNQFGYIDNHFALASMASLLQRNHFIDYSHPTDYWMDVAADKAHPGPQSNINLANALFNTYDKLYSPCQQQIPTR